MTAMTDKENPMPPAAKKGRPPDTGQQVPPKRKPQAKSAFNPPKHEVEAFARCILPAIQAYFESEDGQREFAQWKARQQSKSA